MVEQSSCGDKSVDFEFKIQLIEVGGTQIEFIQAIWGKNVNSDFLAEHGEGVNHLAFLVEDVEAVKAGFARKGFEVVLTQKGERSPGRQ